ncbi:MAG: metallophosphoesterase, partial [Bacillota bacterium]
MSKNLTLLQINDTHAYMESHQELFWNGKQAEYKEVGGYARIATLIKEVKAEMNNQVLVLDNGDTIHGTFAAVNSKGKA